MVRDYRRTSDPHRRQRVGEIRRGWAPVSNNCVEPVIRQSSDCGQGVRPKPWRIGALVVVQLVCVAWTLGAQADSPVSLIDALSTLRGQGYEIFYSNDLVTASQRIDVGVITFEHVQAALPALGLKFARRGNSWLVVSTSATSFWITLHIVSASGEPIDKIEYQVPGEHTLHDATAAGEWFALKLPSRSTAAVTIRARDYHPRTISVSAANDVIVLQPLSQIENVIITGSRHVLPAGIATDSAVTLSAGQLDITPALAGDVMRATNTLPGMASVGISAKPLVRGGVDDETLTLLDGVELLDPYHLADFQSFFSSIDSALVSEINVYTGGFPARYGNRMSGVVDVSTHQADIVPRTELGVSTLATFANTRGVSDDQSTDWLASVRHGNLEVLADWLDPHWGSPKFDDAYVRVGHRISDDVKVSTGLIASRDNISITDHQEVAGSDIDTSYWWTRFDVNHSNSLRSSTLLTYVTSDRNKTEQDLEPGESVGFLRYSQEMEKYVLRSDFTYSHDANLMEFGFDAEYGHSHYDSAALIDRGPIGALLGGPQLETFNIHTSPSGWSGGVYWSGEFWLFDRIALQPGIRWDFQDYYTNGFPSQVSPRFGIRWNATDTITMRFAMGRYYQPEGIQEMKVADGLDHFLSAQQSDHYIGSLSWDPQAGVQFDIEAYYKDYEATRVRFQNIFNPFVLLPELAPDRVAITTSRARARGLDMQVRLDFSSELSGALHYSYLDADDRIGGQWQPRGWAQRNTVQASLVWQDEASALSGRITWHSGWRTSRLPGSVPIGTQLPLAAIYDRNMLDDYMSLDVSASHTWPYGHASITVHADVTNALDSANQGGVDYSFDESVTNLRLFPSNEKLLPWVPTFGVTVAF